jgi:LPS export ABC transporter protein LptC
VLLRVFAVLALLGLALGSWYLTRNHQPEARKATPVSTTKPGYYLKGTVLTDYNVDGAPAVRMAAERIDQDPSANEVLLHNVRLDYTSSSGQLWVMVGERARVFQEGQLIDIAGSVRLQGIERGREGPALISTEWLQYEVPQAIVRTDQNVRVQFARHTLSARGLTARLNESSMRLESEVHGRFNP